MAYMMKISIKSQYMMNISIKSQPHRASGFGGDNVLSIFFFHFVCIMVSMATNTNEQWVKNIWLIQIFSKNISIKVVEIFAITRQ